MSRSARWQFRDSQVRHDRSVLAVMDDRIAAQHDVAELVLPQRAHAVHHPSHAEPGADFLGLARAGRSRADHLLQCDDVGVDIAKHLDDPHRDDAAVHPAAAVDVIGGNPNINHDTDDCRLKIEDSRIDD